MLVYVVRHNFGNTAVAMGRGGADAALLERHRTALVAVTVLVTASVFSPLCYCHWYVHAAALCFSTLSCNAGRTLSVITAKLFFQKFRLLNLVDKINAIGFESRNC